MARRIEASETGDAVAGPGGYANTGVHIGDVYLSPGSPVRSGYLHQVRRIAPRELVGRDEELAELASFCTDPAFAGSYRWWRAPAWSGKTALFSWFALNPPPGVRIISFFVTARLAGQNDRMAFVDNVLEQLQALVGGPVAVTDATRVTRLLGLLDTAAHACQAAGETLVLLVDGLDEDQCADADAGEDRSIAALLPMGPPAGMRVVVSGRPNPPVPGDVPEHHPLRASAVVRPLSASAAAQVARGDMERELERLLQGTSVEQDLLGLLVAAGGGLTGDDLAELTGRTHKQVSDQLRTVAGRSFTRRDSRFRPGEFPDVYLLGHEELRVNVLAALGGERLAGYRDRVHEWADGYRDRRWPTGTPEYLLRGYHPMLLATGELDRAVALSVDRDRHDRMLDMSGGDVHATEEITALLDVLGDQLPPDLATMARLTVRRDHLLSRWIGLPLELPAVWVALGFPGRALSLARSIGVPGMWNDAVLKVADALFTGGHREYAHEAVDHLVADAHAEAVSYDRDGYLMSVVKVLAKAGEMDRAAEVGHMVERPGGMREALLDAAGELAGSAARSLVRHVESLPFDECRSPAEHGGELAKIAAVLTVTGERRRARRLAARARSLVLSESTDWWRANGALAVIRCLNGLGAHHRARSFARKAVLPMAAHPGDYSPWTFETGVRVLADAGLLLRAEWFITHVDSGFSRSTCAAYVALAHARRRDYDAAADVIARWGRRSKLLDLWFEVGMTAARNGDLDQARAIARYQDEVGLGFGEIDGSIMSVAAVKILCSTGDLDEAESAARSIAPVRSQAEALTAVAEALVTAGEMDRAAQLLRQAETAVLGQQMLEDQSGPYLDLAESLRAIGDIDSAHTIADFLPAPRDRAQLLHAEVVTGVAEADAPDRLIELAAKTEFGGFKAQVLAWAAEAMASAGRLEQAHWLLNEAETLVGENWLNRSACPALATAMLRLHQPERALKFVLKHEMSAWRPLYEAMLVTGEHALAAELVQAADAQPADEPVKRLHQRASLVEPFVATGDTRRANEIVQEVLAYLDATPDPQPDSVYLASLTAGVLALLDLSEARHLVDRVRARIRHDATRFDYLVQNDLARPVVTAMMKAGDLDGALELAAMLSTNTSFRTDALLQIAATLLRDGNVARAHPVVAEALRLGEGPTWNRLVTEVGELLPDVVKAVGAEVIRCLRRE